MGLGETMSTVLTVLSSKSWTRDGAVMEEGYPLMFPIWKVVLLKMFRNSKVIPYDELKLVNEIGRGGFGVVMAGLWHDNPVAFKRLHYSQMSAKRKRMK